MAVLEVSSLRIWGGQSLPEIMLNTARMVTSGYNTLQELGPKIATQAAKPAYTEPGKTKHTKTLPSCSTVCLCPLQTKFSPEVDTGNVEILSLRADGEACRWSPDGCGNRTKNLKSSERRIKAVNQGEVTTP